MLDKILKDSARKHPQKKALKYESLSINYEDLYKKVVGLCSGLRSIGIKQGDCIALILPNCPQFLISFFAAAKLHAILLPLNPAFVENEIDFYVSDINAKAIITDLKHAEMCDNIISKSANKIELIVIDETDLPGIYFNDLIKDDAFHDDVSIYEGNILYQYSSGSTGRPKRVSKTQKNLFHEIYNFTTTAGITLSDNILCVIPLFHAHGLGNCMLAAVYKGATLTILEDIKKNNVPVTVPFVLRLQRILELIKMERITNLPGVPFVYSALADTPENIQVDLSAMRLCYSAGNFLPKKTFDKFMQRFGIPIRQMYGCTEAGSISINLEPGSDIKFNSVGLPMNNIDVKIMDDKGQELPQGSVGEIIVKSEALTSGYSNVPELNKEAFKDGYFYTGDLGKKDDEGYLYITGRIKIFIDTGGNKVDPLEVEDVLNTHPNVQEAVVVGVKGPYEGEMIKAVVVTEGDCSDKDIILYCRDKLTSFKIPRIIEFRKEIPKSPLGKILRKDLI